MASAAALRAEAHWYARRYEEAARDYAQAAAADPADTLSRFNLAVALRVLGRLDEAVETWRALVGQPALGLRALAQIGETRPSALSDAEIGALLADQTAESQFAAGRVLDRAGDHDAAFAAFAAGNRLERAALPIRPEQAAAHQQASLEQLRAVFTADFLGQHGGEGHPSNAPILVVGMPRSGSTLIEQILASHPDVEGMDEAQTLAPLLNGRFPYPPGAPKPPGHFRRLGQDYLDAMRRFGWSGSPRFVDKTLTNEAAVGVVHLMLPKAVVIHARRGAIDTCLSCYFQRFAGGNALLYDLKDIAGRYIRHRQMLEHWDAVLPGKVIEVANEALVADPEGGIRNLVGAAGLTWDERCLRFDETARTVATASVSQVRAPIFSTSVARWRRYDKHLGPLIEALGSYADDA